MIGQMRLEKIQNTKRSDVDMTASLQALTGNANTRFVFEEEDRPEWTGLRLDDMSEEERRMAEETWSQNNAIEVDRLRAEDNEESYGLCCIHDYLTKHMKLTTSALHDASLVLGLVLPPDATLLRHFANLHQLVGENARAYAPQNKQILTVESIKSVLKCLQRGGAKFGGVTGNKAVILERLQNVLKAVKQEGKRTQQGDTLAGEDEEHEPEFDQDMTEGATSSKKVSLQVEIRSYGELPANSVVDFQQAESALGHNVADELDDADIQANDKDVQAEEEALLGRWLNPPGLDYSCFMPDFTKLDQKTCEQLGITSNEHKKQWTQDELVLTLSDAQQVLHDSLQAQDENFVQESLSEAMAQNRLEQMQQLDPTQKLAYDTLMQAVQSRPTWHLGDKPGKTTFQMLLLGTAGTGKTATVKASIAEIRSQVGDFKAVLMVAHTGVAASNMGAGAKTIDSIFKLAGDDGKDDLDGAKLHEFVESVRQSRLLVIDEISMVSAEQLELVSRRLEQAAKILYRERHGRRAPASFGGFGGLHVLLVGDFGQIPPVSGKSLISSQAPKGEHRHLSKRGQERFNDIQNVLCLRRIYRQKNAGPFLDSTLRLRDAALQPQDYDLYKEHELGVHRLHADWPGHGDFLKDALRLVAENQVCGRLNGQQLRARTVPEPKDPALLPRAPLDVMKVVLRAKAFHNDARAETKPSAGFRTLKDTVHLSLASPVMLTQNIIWQVNVVPLGLMNGARGFVVGVVYKQEGQARSDGSAVPAGFPCLRAACPLPDFVIVNFPLYSGSAFFPNRPRTWVPVPCVEIRHSLFKSFTRYCLPLRCCWALTIHKCQGITAKEGCVVNFQTATKRNVLLTPGLGFVATTRTEYYEKLAFENLPPYEDFLAIRNTAGFKDRERFEKKAVEKHNQFCKARARWNSGDELRCHIKATEKKSGSAMTDSEVTALTRMLSSNGVQALSDEVFQFLTSQKALASGSSLNAILKSFKASRQTKKPVQGWKAGSAKQTPADREKSLDAQAGTSVLQFVISILCEQGFEKSLASLAVKSCGSDIDKAIDFCLAHSDSVPADMTDLQELQEEQAEEEWIFQSLIRVGLHEMALLDAQAKRRSAINSRALKTTAPPKDCHDQYLQRSMQHWPGSSFSVIDAGMIAATTTNACFWLSLVAAWSRLPRMPYDDAELSALQDKLIELGEWRPQDFAEVNRRGGNDDFGKVVEQLRVLVTGADGYLRGETKMRTFGIAFAALQASAPATQGATTESYNRWLDKVSVNEFADELILAATAEYLKLCIVIVPYTPPTAESQWAISEHPCTAARQEQNIDETRMIVLGNNDVHFVWLCDSL